MAEVDNAVKVASWNCSGLGSEPLVKKWDEVQDQFASCIVCLQEFQNIGKSFSVLSGSTLNCSSGVALPEGTFVSSTPHAKASIWIPPSLEVALKWRSYVDFCAHAMSLSSALIVGEVDIMSAYFTDIPCPPAEFASAE